MKRLSLICLMLLVASIGQAQQMYDELSFPELNEFDVPEVETLTLDNGITFYLLEDDELPVIDVNVLVRTGGVLVPDDKKGLESITGTVIRSGGTETYPADSLNEVLENRAASIETSIGFTSGSARMNVLKEDFNELLPVFVDVLTNPAFPEDKIKLAKTQQQSNISRRNDQAQQIAFREFERLIYGEDSVYGLLTEYETLNNIEREDLVEFHSDHFSGNNLMVGIVGDFSIDEIKPQLQKAFGTVPGGSETELVFPEVEYDYPSTINFINKSDVNQSVVVMGHIGGLRDNPDYPKIQVMNQVLSGGLSGRLFKTIRSDMGLAYSVFGQYGMNSFYPGQFYTGVMTKSSTTAEVIDAIIEQVELLQQEQITEEELQDTKDQVLNSEVFNYDSYEKILGSRIRDEYMGLPEDASEQYLEGVREATIEDVQEMAQEYLKPDQLQMLVVGNEAEVGDQLEKFGDVNEIDISIPEPGSGSEETAEGDAQKGRQFLDQMAQTLLSDNAELNSISMKGSVMQGGMEMPVEMTIDYPDAITQTIESPQGVINMEYKEDSGTMTMGGEERPMPPQMSQSLRETLNRNYLAIANNSSSFDPRYVGMQEFEEKEYAHLRLTVDEKNISLLIDTENGYPRLMRYEQFNPEEGGQVEVEERYDNWNSSDGVSFAYEEVTYIDGNKSAEAIYESHSINE